MHFIRFVSAKGTFSLLNETWTLDSDHWTGSTIRATIDGFVSGMVMASCLPTAAGRIRVGHHHGSYDGAQDSAEQVEEEPPHLLQLFQNFIEFFKQIWTGDQTPRLRLGYINFGAQDGRFHTAKYTIAELTLLIGTIQLSSFIFCLIAKIPTMSC